MDYRLKENRMKVFKDFYWFHTKYKIHPGLVYLYLPEMTKGMTQEQKYWVAFLEGCIQNPNTVWAILQYFPNRPYTEKEVKLFAEFHNCVYSKLEYDTDRIHFKGKLIKQLEEYNKTIGPSSVEMFEKQLYDEDPGKWFTNVFEFILNKVWGFGRMSSWSYTEFIKICCGLNYEFCNFYMTEHDSSMSMRNGLLLLYGFDEMHVWKELPNNPTKHSKELMEWAELEVHALKDYLNTQYTDITVTGETLESALCAFKNMIRGRRYPNIYTDMSYDRIKKAEELWKDQVNFSLFWNIRKDNLPLEFLKEYNYNGYIEEDNKTAVNIKKQIYFRETGLPLYLGLFFEGYEIEKPIIFESNVIKKKNEVLLEEKDIDLNNKFFEKGNYYNYEIKYIKSNNFNKYSFTGKSIFDEFGFDKNWESKMYELTPIELIEDNGKSMYFKREDYFAPLGYGGINGSKFRQALYLGGKKAKNFDVILTGASGISPQLPITCAIAKYYGLSVIGVSPSETSDMIEISKGFGGEFKKISIGYNHFIQKKLLEMKEDLRKEGYKPFIFNYGLSIDIKNSNPEEIKEFYNVGANQVKSLVGTDIEDLIIAIGSANSSTAVMYGLLKEKTNIKRVHLIGVGPSTIEKLKNNLSLLASYEGKFIEEVFSFKGPEENKIEVIFYDTHSKKLWEYLDKIYERFGEVYLHYTYEGKVMRFVKIFLKDLIKPTTCFWIIGSCLNKKILEKYYN